MSARDRALAALQARIGDSFGPARWITVDQGMIDRFADVTQDDQFIHIDPARAADTPLGGTIAHGFLTLSLASRFAYDCFEDLPGQRMGINYGFDRLRFLTPVRPGQRVRGHFTLTVFAPRGVAGIILTSALRNVIVRAAQPPPASAWLSPAASFADA